MAQFDFGQIDTAETSGAELANMFEQHRDAVLSAHKGSARPTYAASGTIWIDDSSGDWVVKLYHQELDVDIEIGTYDVETGTFLVTTGGGGGGMISQVGLFANRGDFDDEDQGFLYFAYDTNDAYVKNSNTSADWSEAFSIQGPSGEDADLSAILAAATPSASADGTIALNVAGGDNLSFKVMLTQDSVVSFPINVPNVGVTIKLHIVQDDPGGHALSFPGANGFMSTNGSNPHPAQGAEEETMYVIDILSLTPARAIVLRSAQRWSLIA